jgi:hypothetical protein
VNALADPKVGEYLNEHFVSAFQKVGTFQILGKQKQGGNVASYFCAQDGRVLHVIPGPVNAETLLAEAKWVVETAEKAIEAHEKKNSSIKSYFRTAHAERLRRLHGLTVEVAKFDAPISGDNSALSYKDPTGKPLAPVLPPSPIEGPDVSIPLVEQKAFRASQADAVKAAEANGAAIVLDRRGGRWAISNQGRAHMLMAAHSMKKIETVYGSVFEGILGEKVTTKPVVVATPFPWYRGGAEAQALKAVPR